MISFKPFKWSLYYVLAILVTGACVERIDFDIPPAQFLTVIEGSITDQPGPYTVKASRGLSLDSDSSFLVPIERARITLLDDLGNTEAFTENAKGIYETKGVMRGTVGRTYRIRIEMPDGKLFESMPELLRPVGQIKEIRYEYEARTQQKFFGEVAADVFNVFVDSDAGAAGSGENFVRWRFRGTYEVLTYPKLHLTFVQGYTPYRNPWPCSGFRIGLGPEGSGGTYEVIGECTCCTCWANQYEEFPQLSDVQLITNNEFKNIKVGEVPINNATFHKKYRVQVEQMALSRNAYDFFKLVRTQKEGASSLFQPPSGELRGNIRPVNSNDPVVGIFWAAAVSTKVITIFPSAVPYPIVPIDFITLPCYDFYPNASSTKPSFWE